MGLVNNWFWKVDRESQVYSVYSDDPVTAYGTWVVAADYLSEPVTDPNPEELTSYRVTREVTDTNETVPSFHVDILNIDSENFGRTYYAKSYITAGGTTYVSNTASSSVTADRHN